METISNWSPDRLSRFIQDVVSSSYIPIQSGQEVEDLSISSNLVVEGNLQINQSVATVSTVNKYFKVTDVSGKALYVPGYNP